MSKEAWLLKPYKLVSRLVQRTPLERMAFVQHIGRMVARQLVPRSVTCDGIDYLLDATDAMHLSTRRRESFVVRYLQSQVKPNDVILDIGAHIGTITLPLAKSVGPDGRVYAFEPDLDNFKLLSKNIAANQICNVVAEHIAVSDRTATIRLYQSTSCSALHRIHPSGYCRRSVEVKAISLNDYFESRPQRVDVVKIDVEGAELRVLRGSQCLIKANPSIRFLIEFVPAWIVEGGHRVDDVVEFFRDNGFVLFEVDEENETIRIADFADLLRRYPPKSNWGTNLWCVPANQCRNCSAKGLT